MYFIKLILMQKKKPQVKHTKQLTPVGESAYPDESAHVCSLSRGGDESAPAAVPVVAHHGVGPARVGDSDRVAREAAAALLLRAWLHQVGHHLNRKGE